MKFPKSQRVTYNRALVILKVQPVVGFCEEEMVTFAHFKSASISKHYLFYCMQSPAMDLQASTPPIWRQQFCLYLLAASFSSPPVPRCAGSPGTVACWPPQTHSPGAVGAVEPCHRLLASS